MLRAVNTAVPELVTKLKRISEPNAPQRPSIRNRLSHPGISRLWPLVASRSASLAAYISSGLRGFRRAVTGEDGGSDRWSDVRHPYIIAGKPLVVSHVAPA